MRRVIARYASKRWHWVKSVNTNLDRALPDRDTIDCAQCCGHNNQLTRNQSVLLVHCGREKSGEAEEDRALDLHIGKVMLFQPLALQHTENQL